MNMKRIVIALLYMLLSIGMKAQIITETISDPFVVSINLDDYIKRESDRWQKELERLRSDRSISDNVKLNVSYKLRENNDKIDMVVEFSYETENPAKVSGYANTAADDYPLGVYDLYKSNAGVLVCDFIKEKIDGELAEYLKEGTEVTINIKGSADGSPIVKPIHYAGEYGDFVDQDVIANGTPAKITIRQRIGIKTNAQLAFLRAQGILHFMQDYIESLKITENTYNIFVVENKEKGEKYRNVVIEVTIHEALTVMPKAKFNKD